MDSLAMLDLLPQITRFLEEPSGSCFLVPSACAGPLTGNLKAAGFATKTVSCAAASHAVEAVVIPLKGGDPKERLDLALTEIFGSPERANLETMLCVVVVVVVVGRAARFLPLVVPKDAKVEIHDRREPLETDRDVKLRNLAFGEYRKALVMLAKLSGLAVHFHAEGGGIRPPFPDEPGVVRILTNACPPGHTTARYVPLAFGLKSNEDGLSALADGPTKGRGGPSFLARLSSLMKAFFLMEIRKTGDGRGQRTDYRGEKKEDSRLLSSVFRLYKKFPATWRGRVMAPQ